MGSYSKSFPGLLEEYLMFLQHHRGLREATLYFHRRWGERFLHHLAERLPDRDPHAADYPDRGRVRVAARS